MVSLETSMLSTSNSSPALKKSSPWRATELDNASGRLPADPIKVGEEFQYGARKTTSTFATLALARFPCFIRSSDACKTRAGQKTPCLAPREYEVAITIPCSMPSTLKSSDPARLYHGPLPTAAEDPAPAFASFAVFRIYFFRPSSNSSNSKSKVFRSSTHIAFHKSPRSSSCR